jgi:DNA-binding helix-hairpin-helix protein with protein kinase domain
MIPVPTSLPPGISRGFFAFVFSAEYREESRKRRTALKEAEQALRNAERRWYRDIDDVCRRFNIKLQELTHKKTEYEGVVAAYNGELSQLKAGAEQSQRLAFLRRHFIRQATISGIGSGRKAILASYGIETAADITRSIGYQVPRFGYVLTERLMMWRASIERQFHFDPRKGVDPADIAALDRKYGVQRQGIERNLTTGLQELRQLRAAAEQKKSGRATELGPLVVRLAQARADASVL